MRVFALSSLALLGATAAAQGCVRPFPVGSGVPPAYDFQVEVTYSDGYRTDGTLIYPDVPAPSCGWPLVVYVHRLGAARLEDIGLVSMIADAGYAVWAYDVRGQASGLGARNSSVPIPGTTMWGAIERYDLAEQIQFAASHAAWQGLVDATRVAVIGPSQGGVHAWAAAAMSGRPLTVPGRGTITFPTISCAIAADYAAEPIHDWLRGGQLWSSWLVDQLSDDLVSPGYLVDPLFLQTAAAAFRAQDPQSLLAAWAAEGRPIADLLPTSTVPVLVSHAYLDLIDSPLPTLEVLPGYGGPTKTLLGTIGHNVPANHIERAFRDQMFVRWLHRWLWNEPNGVELESPFVLAELPLDATERDDLDHPWSRRHVATNPLQPAATTRHWLFDDGSLQTTEPGQALTSSTISNAILDANFTPAFYLASAANRQLSGVLAACPLSESVFATAPLAAEMALSASATVHLRITPDHADWMLAALLTVQPAGGSEVLLSAQAVARDNSAPGLAETVEFTLPPVATRLPAGTVVRLRLRNVWLREAPLGRVLEVAPKFHDFQLLIGRGPAADGSWLDLPLEPVRPSLVTPTLWLDTATMLPLHFDVRGGTARAGSPYFVIGSVSGQAPGAPYQNDVIPINVDWFTGILVVSLATPWFSGFLGDLDAAGNASATMDLSMFAPFDPGLAGLRITYAAYVWDSLLSPGGAASNPIDVFVR